MSINRRDWVKRSAAGAGLLALSEVSKKLTSLRPVVSVPQGSPFSYKHSASRWCYNKIPLGALILACKAIGVASIELLDYDEYKVVIENGLDCAMANGSPLHITKGFNDPKNHDKLLKDYEQLIPRAADYGIRQIICFSGNRNKISDKKGLENCARGLDKVARLAGKYNMLLVMELLNSKVDHKDYQCDHTEWGVALVDKLGSPHFKLLYDIYHMQIMEGDVIATIRKYKDYISHYHTGGVPGRNEIDDTQELNYKAIIKAIAATGYTGYIGQEFIPTRPDPIESLQDAVRICTVRSDGL
ncbi:MAG: TIM barrel protein [Saprospiraceae bacterium]|nr:TIM barrel protein [Saprospiraceae bacterium]